MIQLCALGSALSGLPATWRAAGQFAVLVAFCIGVACRPVRPGPVVQPQQGRWSASVIAPRQLEISQRTAVWVGVTNTGKEPRAIFGDLDISYQIRFLPKGEWIAVGQQPSACAHYSREARLVLPGETHYQLYMVHLDRREVVPGPAKLILSIAVTPMDSRARCLDEKVRLRWRKQLTIVLGPSPD